MVCLFRVCGLLGSRVESLAAARARVMSVFVCENCACVFGVLVSVCACLKSSACSVMVRSVIVVMRKVIRVKMWRLGVFLTFRGCVVSVLSGVVAFVLISEAGGWLGRAMCSGVLVGGKK